MRRIVIRSVLAALGFALALAATEVGLRLLSRRICIASSSVPAVFDPVSGWRRPPGGTGRHTLCIDRGFHYDIPIEFNGHGHRGQEYPLQRVPGASRILVLGDSITEALQVTTDERFTERLQVAFGERGTPVEVVNTGVSGYATDNELTYFRDSGRDYSPDIVLLMINLQNDVLENDPALYLSAYLASNWPAHIKTEARLRPDGTLHLDTAALDAFAVEIARSGRNGLDAMIPWWFRLRQRSLLVQLLLDSLAIAPPIYGAEQERIWALREQRRVPTGNVPLYLTVHLRRPDSDWTRAWHVTDALLAALDREVKASGSVLLAAVVPAQSATEMNWWQFWTNRSPELRGERGDRDWPGARMMTSLAAAGIPALDLTPAMRLARSSEKRPLFFEYDAHLRPPGHAAVADALERWLAPCFGPNGYAPTSRCPAAAMSGGAGVRRGGSAARRALPG